MKRPISRLAGLASAGLIFLAGCILPGPAGTTITPAIPTVTLPAEATGTTAPPTSAATAAATAEPTPASDTATPAATGQPTSGSSAPVITAENAARLAANPLTLPEWPGQLLWPGPSAALPPFNPPAPPLIIRSEGSLYPVTLDPPGVGSAAALAVPGNITAYSPDLTSVLSIGENAPAALYDLTGKQLRTFDTPAPYGGSFSPSGKLVVIASQNEIAGQIYDLTTGQAGPKLSGFQTAAPVYSISIAPGDQWAYWVSRATFQLQNIQTGALGKALNFSDFIGSLAFTPDGSRLILSVEGKLIEYQMPDLQELHRITLSQPVSSLSISPDGSLIAAGYGANIQIWDSQSLSPIITLPGPNDFSGLVAFSPDGRYLVSVHTGNILNIWQVR